MMKPGQPGNMNTNYKHTKATKQNERQRNMKRTKMRNKIRANYKNAPCPRASSRNCHYSGKHRARALCDAGVKRDVTKRIYQVEKQVNVSNQALNSALSMTWSMKCDLWMGVRVMALISGYTTCIVTCCLHVLFNCLTSFVSLHFSF